MSEEREVFDPAAPGDKCLRFPNAASALATFRAAGWTFKDEDGKEFIPQAIHNVCAISIVGSGSGKVHKQTGRMLRVDDMDVPEMRPVLGYHVNVRTAVPFPAVLQKFLVDPQPATPSEVWA